MKEAQRKMGWVLETNASFERRKRQMGTKRILKEVRMRGGV